MTVDDALARLPEEYRARWRYVTCATSSTPRSPRRSRSPPARSAPASAGASPAGRAVGREPDRPRRASKRGAMTNPPLPDDELASVLVDGLGDDQERARLASTPHWRRGWSSSVPSARPWPRRLRALPHRPRPGSGPSPRRWPRRGDPARAPADARGRPRRRSAQPPQRRGSRPRRRPPSWRSRSSVPFAALRDPGADSDTPGSLAARRTARHHPRRGGRPASGNRPSTRPAPTPAAGGATHHGHRPERPGQQTRATSGGRRTTADRAARRRRRRDRPAAADGLPRPRLDRRVRRPARPIAALPAIADRRRRPRPRPRRDRPNGAAWWPGSPGSAAPPPSSSWTARRRAPLLVTCSPTATRSRGRRGPRLRGWLSNRRRGSARTRRSNPWDEPSRDWAVAAADTIDPCGRSHP